jgi:lipoprotein-releasing system permease protein
MFKPWLPFEWIVAIRFLREGRLQTVFILVGVAIGVGVIVFMSALLAGLQGNFIARVLSAQSHIQLLPSKEVTRTLHATTPKEVDAAIVQPPLQRLKSMDQWKSVLSTVRRMPDVVVASPVVGGSALAVRGSASRAISLTGVESDDYFLIVKLPDKMVRGASRLTGQDILIGLELASDLGVDVGDKLRVANAAGVATTLTVSGVFDLGNKGANQRSTFVALRTAQSVLDLLGGVTSIELTVRDVYAAEVIAQRIQAVTGLEADSWIKTGAQFFAALSAQTTANTAIRFFVGLSVAFGIASVLVVSVVQKSREIGILRAMGISRGQVLRVFLLQGGLLGWGGAVLGCVVGAVGLVLWQHLALNADGTPLFPLVLDPKLFAMALGLATVTGLAAAYAPALRAARLNPVEAIHG